jgi:hypothetical protein
VNRYIYVEARDVSGGGFSPLISFHHIPVQALHEEDAYREGQDRIATLIAEGVNVDLALDGHFLGRFLNDYVIEVK